MDRTGSSATEQCMHTARWHIHERKTKAVHEEELQQEEAVEGEYEVEALPTRGMSCLSVKHASLHPYFALP